MSTVYTASMKTVTQIAIDLGAARHKIDYICKTNDIKSEMHGNCRVYGSAAVKKIKKLYQGESG